MDPLGRPRPRHRAFARAATGRFTRRPWTPADDATGRWFVISVDIQVLLGLLLYFFFSSFTMAAWRDMAGAMADKVNPLLGG
jgi:hypothetical protein